jgi:hypothetical protein
LPPRIIAKLSWLPKIAEPAMRGHRLLAGVDEVGIHFASVGNGPMPSRPFSLCSHTSMPGHVVGHQRGQADAEVHVEAVGEFPGRARGHLVAGPGHGLLHSFSVIVRFSMRFSGVALTTMRCT